MLAELLLTCAVGLTSYALYKWATVRNEYFKQRGIKDVDLKFAFGNAGTIFNKFSVLEFAQRLYSQFPNEGIYGMFEFRTPIFVARDPEIIKQIAVKDFEHFEDRRSFVDETTDKLFGNSLFMLKGDKWRDMRATLSPAFTGSKMRQMFELVTECADDMVKFFLKQAENGKQINQEMKDLFSRYTNDVIASCAFGIKVNSFENRENDFYVFGKRLLNFGGVLSIVKILLMTKLPKVAKAFNIQFISSSSAKDFKSMILDTMEIRKSKNIFRPDMINIMMQIRQGSLRQQTDEKDKDKDDGFATVEESAVGQVSVQRKWNDDEIVAQCFLFFFAGFDTSSTMLTFASYELTVNPDIQNRLYKEIAETNERIGGKRIDYDSLQKMKYLDQVICETLRKWPPVSQIERLCVKDYTFDDGDKYKFRVEKGKVFLIPIYGLQYDPKYFPDPEKFNPDRFSDENKDSILAGTYIPFGVGPRNCVGSRFALMEVKAILYYLLLNFSFEVNNKTQIPIKLKKTVLSLITEKGLDLELKPRKK